MRPEAGIIFEILGLLDFVVEHCGEGFDRITTLTERGEHILDSFSKIHFIIWSTRTLVASTGNIFSFFLTTAIEN